MLSKKIVLASASPRRKELLVKLGLKFIVDPSLSEEKTKQVSSFGILAANIAEQKADMVALNHKNSLIIGADTIVVLGDQVMGKPSSKEEAEQTLVALSGKWHQVFTGLVIIDTETNIRVKDHETSKVKLKELSSTEIQNYIATGEPMDKAGSYGIQGLGALLVEKIEGCYYNIVGLPLLKLNQMLARFDAQIL